jgi:hypothetical protein
VHDNARTVRTSAQNHASCRPSDNGKWSAGEPDSVNSADQTAIVGGRCSARVEIPVGRLRIGQIMEQGVQKERIYEWSVTLTSSPLDNFQGPCRAMMQ